MAVAPRERFEAVADAYERSRPGYPGELLRRLGPPCRTLEIGCGTAQLTVDLVKHGHDVVALDLGERLLAHARRRCPKGEFVLGAFEEVDLGQRRFDLVVSATAFHWVDAKAGYPKAAAHLRPGGRLALLSHRVVVGPGSDQFDAVVRHCAPSFPLGAAPSTRTLHAAVRAAGAGNISTVLAAIEGRPTLRTDADRWFGHVELNAAQWDQSLTAEQLLQALAATSVWTTLPQHEKARLTDRLRAMVSDLGGRILRRRLTFLAIAERRV
jgi:SAM-dependent methyltransferase